MEKAVRIKRRQIRDHGRIGPKEDSGNISDGKKGKDKSHKLKAEGSKEKGKRSKEVIESLVSKSLVIESDFE